MGAGGKHASFGKALMSYIFELSHYHACLFLIFKCSLIFQYKVCCSLLNRVSDSSPFKKNLPLLAEFCFRESAGWLGTLIYLANID